MSLALEGIRIIDLTTWQQGSGGPGLLADLGAEVIKVERPIVGDPARGVTMSPLEADRPVRSLFEAANRGKRGITLDFKSDEGREVLYALIETADVVAMNFRSGVAARLGVDYATLSTRKPDIIVASTNGLGPDGPEANRGLFDIMGQARSGLMKLLSDPDQPTRYVGPWGLSDQTAAVMFATSILTALVARSLHGVGQEVSVSQLGSSIAWQTLPLHAYLFTGEQPSPRPRKESRTPLFNLYRGSDDLWFCLSCTPPDAYWTRLCSALEREDLATDPRFADNPTRTENAAALVSELDAIFATRPRHEWMERLETHEVIANAVQEYADLLNDPQVRANRYIDEVEHPSMGRMSVVGCPIKLSETPSRGPAIAPEFGQHTEEVLTELGLEWSEISELREKGLI